MEPLKVYNYLTLSRRKVFDWVRLLPAEDYTREILSGQRTLGQTLTHIMVSEWYYLQRIQGLPVPPYDQWPIKDENPPPFEVVERTWTEQASRARQVLSSVRDWVTDLEYPVTDDDGRPSIVTASPRDIFTQLVLHEVHHRAQVMVLLRRLGVPAADIDFNTLMYKRRAASPA